LLAKQELLTCAATAQTGKQHTDFSCTDIILIGGATGFAGNFINGRYDPTGDADGYVQYTKHNDDGVCMQHYAGMWEVKAMSAAGSSECYAYVTGGCALRACVSRVWGLVDENGQRSDQPLKMVISSLVCIRGATGVHSSSINGFYEPDVESDSSGSCVVVYRKRDDDGTCIEHRAGDWEVKPVAARGTADLYAYVQGGCALEACAARTWTVHDKKAWQAQRGVMILAGGDAERE